MKRFLVVLFIATCVLGALVPNKPCFGQEVQGLELRLSVCSGCYIYKRYIVCTKAGKESVGEDIRVFDRTSKDFQCGKNNKGPLRIAVANKFAYWFVGIYKHFLFMSNKTGPNGELFVIDLNSKKKIFTGDDEDVGVEEPNRLRYWKIKYEVDSILECPEKDRTDEIVDWLNNNSGPVVLAEKMYMDLETRKEVRTGYLRCFIRQ